MRYWTINYKSTNMLGEAYTKWETWSDTEILDYWESWSGSMKRAFYEKRLISRDGLDLITPEQCIKDWVSAHRAVRNTWIEMKECIA